MSNDKKMNNNDNIYLFPIIIKTKLNYNIYLFPIIKKWILMIIFSYNQ